jgi:4-carboxymuconolactone decarboxylase
VPLPARLPTLTRDQLGPEQEALWRSVVEGPRLHGRAADPESLGGPFNAWLYSPVAGRLAADLGEQLRFRSTLTPRQREIAILVVGAHWKAEYEFWAHADLARLAGIGDDLIAPLRDGTVPDLRDEAEAVVHAVASELLTSGALSDERHERAVELLGREGVVDLVLLVGYYCTVSFTLNAFRVALPPEAPPIWPVPGP